MNKKEMIGEDQNTRTLFNSPTVFFFLSFYHSSTFYLNSDGFTSKDAWRTCRGDEVRHGHTTEDAFLSSSIDYESDAEVVGSGGDVEGVDGAAKVELHAGSQRRA